MKNRLARTGHQLGKGVKKIFATPSSALRRRRRYKPAHSHGPFAQAQTVEHEENPSPSRRGSPNVMHLAASLRLAKHDLLDFLDECCLGALLPGSEQERLVAEPCLGEGGVLYPRPMVIYSRPFASPACRRDSLDRMENLRISRAGCRERRLHFSCSWRLGDRPRRVALLIDDAQEEYRSLMPPRVLSRLCDLVAAARAAGAVSLWSHRR